MGFPDPGKCPHPSHVKLLEFSGSRPRSSGLSCSKGRCRYPQDKFLSRQNVMQKVDLHCFKLHRSYLVSFNLPNVGETFWVESIRTVSRFTKRNRTFCAVLTYSIKRANQIGTFHVAVVQQRLINVQKSVTHA